MRRKNRRDYTRPNKKESMWFTISSASLAHFPDSKKNDTKTMSTVIASCTKEKKTCFSLNRMDILPKKVLSLFFFPPIPSQLMSPTCNNCWPRRTERKGDRKEGGRGRFFLLLLSSRLSIYVCSENPDGERKKEKGRKESILQLKAYSTKLRN